jgi:Na+/glutamate symporter
MVLNDKVYDVLKWIGLIVLPAIATLVKAVFPVWNLPYADAIATTCTSLGVFVGAIIGVSQATNSANTKVTEVITDAEEIDADTEYTDETVEEKNGAEG